MFYKLFYVFDHYFTDFEETSLDEGYQKVGYKEKSQNYIDARRRF